MPRDGSGGYALPAGNPVVTGTTISSTVQNNTTSDIATALTGSLAADGQTAWGGNQNANGNRITSLAASAALTDSVNANDVQSGKLMYLTGVAGTNAITASLGSLAAYTTGQTFNFIAANTNTGAVTLNVNSLGAKAITKAGTIALQSGEIGSAQMVTVRYDGAQFQMVAPPMQTTSDQTASRAKGFTYTNSTGRTIFVVVSGTATANGSPTVTVNSVGFTGPQAYALNAVINLSFAVGSGETYGITDGSGTFTISKWVETR